MNRQWGVTRERNTTSMPRGGGLWPQPSCATENHTAVEKREVPGHCSAPFFPGSIDFVSQIRTQTLEEQKLPDHNSHESERHVHVKSV